MGGVSSRCVLDGPKQTDKDPSGSAVIGPTNSADCARGSLNIIAERTQGGLAAGSRTSAFVEEETYLLPHSNRPESPDRVQSDCKETVKSEACILPDIPACDDGQKCKQNVMVQASNMPPYAGPVTRSAVRSRVAELDPTNTAEAGPRTVNSSGDLLCWEPSSDEDDSSEEEWMPGGHVSGGTRGRKRRACSGQGQNVNGHIDRAKSTSQERQAGYVRCAEKSLRQGSRSTKETVSSMARCAQESPQQMPQGSIPQLAASLMCCTCPMVFNTVQTLVQHQAEMHPGADSANCRCSMCKAIVPAAYLRQHLMRDPHCDVNSVRRICLHCGKTFTDSIIFAEHMSSVHQDDSVFHRCDRCRQTVRSGQVVLHRRFFCSVAARGSGKDSRPYGQNTLHLHSEETLRATADHQQTSTVQQVSAAQQAVTSDQTRPAAVDQQVSTAQLAGRDSHNTLPAVARQTSAEQSSAGHQVSAARQAVTNDQARPAAAARSSDRDDQQSSADCRPQQQYAFGSPTRQRACDICGKVFACSMFLQDHYDRVHGERTTCTICGKKYTAVEMRRHMVRHQTAVCYKCGKVYNKGTIKKHLKSHADKEQSKSFICGECGVTFISRERLHCHLRRMHTGMHVRHRNRNSLCQVCGKAFSGGFLLANHMRTHTGERPYTCYICFKSFTQEQSLWRHRTVHSLERPYRCDVCDMGFSQSSGLKTHRDTDRHKAKVHEKGMNCVELEARSSDKHVGGEAAVAASTPGASGSSSAL